MIKQTLLHMPVAGLLVILLLFAAMQPDETGVPGSKGSLLFQSGFEPGSAIRTGVTHTGNDKIVGWDESVSPPNDWVEDIDNSDRLGVFTLQYQGGDMTQRKARIVPEPGNPDNHVLLMQINEPWVSPAGRNMARVQANIYDSHRENGEAGIRELYQKVRLYLHEDMEKLKYYPDRIDWLTIFELWNNHSWDDAPYPFRITVGVGKPGRESSDLHFIVDAEDYVATSRREKIWSDMASGVPVPVGRWMTLEFYIREGDEQTGHFFMAMTPDGGDKKVLFDERNYTHNTTDPGPGGITHWNPMKLYTSRQLTEYMKDNGASLRIYWDDLEIREIR